MTMIKRREKRGAGDSNYQCSECYCWRATDNIHPDNPEACLALQEKQRKVVPAMPFIPSWDMSEANKRMMLLAAHLETADARHMVYGEPTYDQQEMYHPCGAPACAIGHNRELYSHTSLHWSASRMFQLSVREWSEMFGWKGCNRAKTAKQAAAYIRTFALRRHFGAKAGT